MKRKRLVSFFSRRFLVLGMVSLLTAHAFACTSVIVSGRITKDGRPLIFKNRDTGTLGNAMQVIQGERYRFVALLNDDDLKNENVWGGHNEKGFAIINTAAFNLNGHNGDDTDGDGIFMRRALEVCSSLKDFENLLDTFPRPRQVNSNFGVLDAHGGCAYYETGNFNYVKFDVNDPAVAPKGYLMRTNHGMTGDREFDKGVERYCAINDFMEMAEADDNINCRHLLTEIPRYLVNGLTKIDMYDFMPEDDSKARMFSTQDLICRYSTSSAILVQGVAKGEPAINTVSWTICGWPLTTVAMPLVLLPSGKLPKMVMRNAENVAPLCELGMTLKKKVYCLKTGSKESYIDLGKLINKRQTGLLQRIRPIEDEVLDRGEAALVLWRKKGKKSKSMDEFYDWIDQFVAEKYAVLK